MARRGHGDGGIDQRGDGRWRLRWRKDSQRFQKAFGGSLADAKKELRRLMEDEKPASGGPKLADWLQKWLSEDPNLSPKTRERYQQLAEKQILPHLAASASKNSPRLGFWNGTPRC